ncbi:Pimeloyl-ACP methyl ester carboxylesterase [Lentzea xinjiangensis]|uniref:Pimeloyl-ACP methyl ester carboxylesterase n=1 Tax=Lentzea xinjiangensis TaxID=402600 RepID=A0A1H9MKQ4_9PSEU|nr:alpha/beta hydrolase [Lentzea xinjiangensis]SER24290.1 Pimeloyl-ACP methyl ester carboxylesterase [Lentzea xinjiangensis]
MTRFTTSADGTGIACSTTGSGPALILVDGAMCHRRFGPSTELASVLDKNFTVHTYDRRGRGETGDGATPWSLEREVEDIDALIREAGGSAFVFGVSSGAVLALEAASRLPGISGLAIYEAPFVVDDTYRPRPADIVRQMNDLLARGDRSGMLSKFMKMVGAPGIGVAVMKLTPMWKKLKQVAHTLPWDLAILGDDGRGTPLPTGRWNVQVPTLAMDGGKSPQYLRNAMKNVAEVLGANTEHRTLAGQTHMYKPSVVAPELVEFFSRVQRTAGPVA